MKPLLFGSRKAPLFGIYYAPLAKSARDRAVVICNPFGQEAIFAHRGLRQLALALARARFHVLRFDYSGTGDSAGEGDDATLRSWCADVRSASEEVQATAGVDKVAWVGLRLGAAVAALAAKKDVDRVVAWDPIVHGVTYLRELHQRHQEFMRYEHRWWEPGQEDWGQMTEALGFPLSKQLRRDLLELDLVERCPFASAKTTFVISDETDGHRALRKRFTTDGDKLSPNVSYTLVRGTAWNSEAALNSSLVPTTAIQAIVDTLSEGRP